MTKSSLASLLLLSSISAIAACGSRAPAPSKPITGTAPVPPADYCDLDGPVLYKRVTTSPRDATVSVVLYKSGGWNVDRGGKASSGCLNLPDLARLESDLMMARYRIFPPSIPRCMSHDGVVTVYEVQGKRVWTAELCGDEVLDDHSRDVLTTTDTLLETASDPTIPPPEPRST